jgi:hypothetical protein
MRALCNQFSTDRNKSPLSSWTASVTIAAGLAALGLALGISEALAGGGTARPPQPPTNQPPPPLVEVPLPPTVPAPTFTNIANTDQFTVVGFIQNATVDADDSRCPGVPANRWGGTLKVNGITYIVPCNTILQMPAVAITWADMLNGAAFPRSLTLDGGRRGYPSFEVTVIGNRVNKDYIAALIYVSQQSLNSGQGYIVGFDYARSVILVGAKDGPAQVRLQLNDPLGRFSRAHSVDERFSVDEDNPTVHAATGYPMCIPRFDPAERNDPRCPKKNRPLSRKGCRTFLQAGVIAPQGWVLSPPRPEDVYCMAFVMEDPATRQASDPDPSQQAPFEIGDYVTYSGTLMNDSLGPDGSSTISVHSLEANVGIFTQPGALPAYVSITAFGVAAADAPVSVNGEPEEALERMFLVANTTDVTSVADIYLVDYDPATGEESNRWITPDSMTAGVTLGSPPFGGGITTQFIGPQPGRIRIRAVRTPAGMLDSPTRNIRVVLRSLCGPDVINKHIAATAPSFANVGYAINFVDPAGPKCLERSPAANGLFAGQYLAPNFLFIFPENVVAGDPIVPFNFWDMGFLVNGEGPGTGPLIPRPW